jgi:hypothetical protein
MSFKHSTRKGVFRTGCHDENHPEIVAALSRVGPEPIEVKAPDGTLTPAQVRFHAEWRGGPLFTIQNAADIPAMIEEIQRPTVRRRVIG